MSDKPTISDIRGATGISNSYASMILSGQRVPPKSLAIAILRATGWRHDTIAELSDDEIAVLERVDPWKSKVASQ